MNATVGIYQDYDAEKALDALKELQSNMAIVLRDGAYSEVKARDLVPGDIVKVSAGDKVPADMRIIHVTTTTFRVSQSILTGESQDVNKYVDIVKTPNALIIDKINIAFSGTLVTSGTAIGVVTGTGNFLFLFNNR